jgi:ABC-type multidrug transport system ATPase subunit
LPLSSKVGPEELGSDDGMKPQGIPAPPGGDPPLAPELVGIPYTPGAPIVGEAPETVSSPAAAVQHLSYWQEVPRQTLALLTKNFILARRNRFSTFLRLFASLFFILLIFLVNEGIKSRTASLSSYKDLTDPERVVVGGIPSCKVARGREKCYTFGYIPAPYPEYRPDVTYPNLAAWRSAVDLTNKAVDGWCDKTAGGTRCEEADCKRGTEVPACSDCCAQWRTHQVVRAIMKNNGTAAIPPEKIMGWPNETVADKFILDNPQDIQGTYIFNSPDYKTMTFLVQQNSSRADAVREVWTRPFLEATVPMQVAAMKEIARVVFLNESNLPFEIAMQEYPHPAVNVATFEGVVAPLYLLGCAMFPFVIQMTEVVYEREFKLRQALAAMGLYDLSYWFSWHIYQSALAFFSSFFLYAFGCLFQFSLFLKNDFGVIFITFWMFGQAMVGFGFLIGAFLSRSAQAVTVGFGFFMIGFILYFVIVAGIPFGTLKGGTAPLSYVTNATTGNLTAVTTGEQVVEPLFAAIPPTLLVKVVADLGVLTATDKDVGLRFHEAYSYCTLDVNCNPSYSIGMCWITWIIEYILYSFLALYFENVLPDAMGVRKAPWYFLTPSYWGYGEPRIVDKVEVIEASTDEDVIAEEQIMTQRANQPFDPVQAIEIRGLRQTFSRGGKAFHAVKDPWYAVGRKQLFALLGPNGAGKTTTINMLTGFLPPTTGNALVLGHTVAHPSGMNRIKRFMGVCPQFDILWDNLTAKEHLMLFGTIKGIASDAVAAEADRRIEQVRLSESANQVSGAFSGGMKRRLSVAVALIGDPQVVYLDEPTTGMDPINRRHVWDVIEAAKQDRTIVLTTHSMEEADILGDRIAIMAKGRLRCLGNAVRLKNRFGAGYRVSVSCGDNMKPDGPQCMGVKQMFLDSFGSQVSPPPLPPVLTGQVSSIPSY